LTATKEKIIEAAYSCFAEKGYIGTTTREIAKTAGVSEITLFRYFRTKAALFEAVINRYSILSDLKKIASENNDKNIEETIKHIAKRIYLTLRKKKKLIRIILSEITNHPNEITEIYNKFLARIDSMLLKIFEQKKEKIELKENLNLQLAVRGFHCMLFAFFQTNEIFLKKELSEQEIEETINTFVNILFEGIKKEGNK